MTDLAIPSAESLATSGGPVRALRDVWTVTKRNLIRQVRVPESIFFSSLQPVMFVLLFTYVFGGAIPVQGTTYVNYLMPGIFVQTMCFGAVSTSIGLAEDLQSGLLERFRALPMSRAAVLGGRTSADVVRNVFVVILMTVVGFLVGFRPTGNVATYTAACLVMLLFSYALMWGFAYIGLSAPNAEVAQLMSFPILFPLTFASTAFVPVGTMPSWLQGFAENQPVSVTVDAARSLMIGGVYHSEGAVLKAVAWSVGLFLVLAPLAVRKYRKV
jgi:ABC-2 type transport system permease protein/oleandomycin transport system permease protein